MYDWRGIITSVAQLLDIYWKFNSMKHTCTFLLFAANILFLNGLKAQPNAGLKAGVNYASLSGYEGDRRISFHGGVYVQVPLHKNWTIQPELLYSGEGQHYTISEGEESTPVDKTITFSYVALPVMLRFNPSSKIYLEAGPQAAILVSARSLGYGTDHFNMKRSFANGQFGFNTGAGFQINPRISIYARYYFGMTDAKPSDAVANKNQVGQLGFTLRLTKNKIVADKK